ncbi:hypothetical protein mEp013_60 [Escherichia phage mEp013]
MSRNQRYQCTYSRCSAFFKNGKIYEVGAALVDAKNQEYIHAITDDQGQLWRFYKMGCGTALVYARAGGGEWVAPIIKTTRETIKIFLDAGELVKVSDL